MTTVEQIELNLVYPIRNEVLRKGKPIETCYFNDDEKDSTVHFGLFFEKEIVGIVSLFEQNNILFNEEKQFQIRGMAVLEVHHKKGFGNLLLKKCEDYCKKSKANLIWFNARENATPFYKKNEYEIIGNSFLIENIGLHYIMFKKL